MLTDSSTIAPIPLNMCRSGISNVSTVTDILLPPGYIIFCEDLYAGNGLSQQEILEISAKSSRLNGLWLALTDKQRMEWTAYAQRNANAKT